MIQFILNDKTIKTSVNSGVTLLDFIRENKSLKGTKIGCREGDCGACTVLVGTLKNNEISYQSITSCISPLGNANGKHIVTIEGVNLPKTLNLVQQAMTNNFATQCGFCTPGFVVSMTGFALKSSNTHKNNAPLNSCNDALSGNICRCTGYKSIEKAGAEIEEKLIKKDQNMPVDWLVKEGFIPEYFKSIPNQIKQLKIKDLNKEGIIVANGTDLYVRDADNLSEESIHLIANNSALKGITIKGNTCTIGASTTVTEILENKYLQSFFPKLPSYLKLISSEQIRNMGTLGGNFVNASPIGDMSIFFLALNASLGLQNKNGNTRKIPLKEFYQDYKKYDLKKEEIIKSISFEILDKSDRFNFEKVSKRTHLDIASVNTASKITIKNEKVSMANFSFGGVAAIPKYAEKTSQYFIGKNINAEIIKNAETILQSEISPISDVRGSATYKRLLARQLFFAHFITLFPSKVQLDKLITS